MGGWRSFVATVGVSRAPSPHPAPSNSANIARPDRRDTRAVSGGNESGFPSGLEEAILVG